MHSAFLLCSRNVLQPFNKLVTLAKQIPFRTIKMAARHPTLAPAIPSFPSPLVATGTVSFPYKSMDLVKIALQREREYNDKIFELAKSLNAKTHRVSYLFQLGQMEEARAHLEVAAKEAIDLVSLEPPSKWVTRSHGTVASALESFICVRCQDVFFSKGVLAPQSEFSTFEDSEYLSGVIRFCQELCRYAIGQATAGDAGSVLLCKNVVATVQKKLIEFDFRNGPLRRKYDGVKYAVKRLEDILYELSLTGAYVAADVADERAAKKARTVSQSDAGVAEEKSNGGDDTDPSGAASASAVVTESDFDNIRTKLELYDSKREDVIKKTRDVQKLSKQAIFSLHRGQIETAKAQLHKAKGIADGIYTTYIDQDPGLRSGSYANSIEEYTEGVLFLLWLESDDSEICPIDVAELDGQCLPHDYLGGLVDFTGEVGRYAVLAASKRDDARVRKSLAAVLAVEEALTSLNLSGKYGKKASELRNNVKKLEVVLYELSLVKASGRNVTTAISADDTAPATDD
eukprot:m.714827 g.714827  ORF g.714827 m.714827 type:complete len:515 (-) comp22973_c1_seq1:413-1957(-)